jgi:hypothetical protein
LNHSKVHYSAIALTLSPPSSGPRFTWLYSLGPKFSPFKTSRSPQILLCSHFLSHLLLPRPSLTSFTTGQYLHSCPCLLPSFASNSPTVPLGRPDSLVHSLSLEDFPACVLDKMVENELYYFVCLSVCPPVHPSSHLS